MKFSKIKIIKIKLRIEKLDIIKETKSVGIEVVKTQKYNGQFRTRKK